MRYWLEDGEVQWTEPLEQSESGALQTRVMVPNPDKYLGMSAGGAKALSVILLCLILGGLVFLSYLYLRKRDIITVMSVDHEAGVIRRKYGDRVAEVKEPTIAQGETVQLVSIEELVKIADELGKPIFHQSKKGPQPKHEYYIIDGPNRYTYTI